ncbi:hypothetical protein FQ707_13490 [Bacteroidaceae bacterium HV4-6-C5C]|jgi:hypothetical protein|nr:hypothetical protein FQ707_13490 [Bacteroidaceae bacterium HV4-6-C5C]
MKKVILTAAFMMFVSGNVFLANAQDPVKKEKPVTEQSKDSTANKPAKEDSTPEKSKSEEPKKDQPSDSPAKDSPTVDKSTQPAK